MLNFLKKVPAPIFGNAAVAFRFGLQKSTALPKYAPWAVPGIVGGLWFVWPAVDEEWKQSIGIGSSSADPAASPAAEDQKEEPIVLSEEAVEKVEKAYVVETVELTDAEKEAMKSVEKGDFTVFEKDWDNFNLKAMNPEEDDDDDDDDDEEEEEEEEDEE